MGVRVVTDSACDLPDELVAALGLSIVPLTIRFGDEELVDREELSVAEFWQRLTTSPVLPETAAPSAGAFEACFRDLADGGADRHRLHQPVVATLGDHAGGTRLPPRRSPTTARSRSSTPSRAPWASERSASPRRAARSRARSSRRSSPRSPDRRDRTKLFGTLDTLEFLKRGGRVGNARALLGSMLSIKPVVEVRDGVVEEAGKVRTRSKALQVLVDHVRAQPVENLAVLHGQRTRPRRAPRPARPDRAPGRDRHRHCRARHRHPRRAPRHRCDLPGRGGACLRARSHRR